MNILNMQNNAMTKPLNQNKMKDRLKVIYKELDKDLPFELQGIVVVVGFTLIMLCLYVNKII